MGAFVPPGSPPKTVNGSLILTLGIVSFFVHVVGPVAWILGNQALAALERGEGDPAQWPDVKQGRLFGIINTVWMIFLILLVLGFGIWAVWFVHS